jgi:hypothetical protein
MLLPSQSLEIDGFLLTSFLLPLALAMVGFGLACCHLVDLDEKMS